MHESVASGLAGNYYLPRQLTGSSVAPGDHLEVWKNKTSSDPVDALVIRLSIEANSAVRPAAHRRPFFRLRRCCPPLTLERSPLAVFFVPPLTLE